VTADPRTQADQLVDLRDDLRSTSPTEAQVDMLVELFTTPSQREPRSDRIVRIGAEIIIALHSTPFHATAQRLLVQLLDESLARVEARGAVTTERLVALEYLTYALVQFQHRTGSLRCLAQYRQEVVTFALQHGAALPFERHGSRVLVAAATRAYEDASRSIAVVAAESGRMKYLAMRRASLTTGERTPTWGATDIVAQLNRHGVPDAHDASGNSSLESAAMFVGRMRKWVAASTDDLVAAVDDVVSHWRSVAAPPRVPVPTALPRDLDMVDIRRLCAPGQGLIYPFLRSDAPGLILVTADDDMSVQIPPERLDDYDDILSVDGLWAKHGWVGVATFKEHAEFRDPVVIAWADAMSPALAEIVRGINAWTLPIRDSYPTTADVSEPSAEDAEEWRRSLLRPATVLPSAQLLRPELLPVERLSSAYLGDASDDLVGPWLEREDWLALDVHRAAMGADATVERLLDGLRTCDLVIVSSHAAVDEDGNPFLQLADGRLRVDDLLESSLADRGTQVVLNCCRASSYSEAVAAEEAIGMATALLTMGARQVLAPRVAVSDGSAAALGVLLARELVREPELRMAWRMVWFRLQHLAKADAPLEDLFDLSLSTAGSPHLASDARRSLRGLTWPQIVAEYGEYLVWGQ
jgi:hypothetical protein